jgi:hypothetical protein
MNTVSKQVEVKVEAGVDETQLGEKAEAVKELSLIELAYVGGGTASVSFV